MAKNLRPHVRWIASELNSSDEPSREHDSECSKLLTQHLEHLEFDRVRDCRLLTSIPEREPRTHGGQTRTSTDYA
eukprot:7217689-Heterocapsa_arctica.AAC.1